MAALLSELVIAAVSVGWVARSEISSRIGATIVGGRYVGRDGVTMQVGAVDCGAAALTMVFREHGLRAMILDSLREAVIARGSGLSFLELQQVSQAHGLPAQGYVLAFEQLAHAALPAIAHFPGHFVVVDSVRGDDVVIRDPAIGRLLLSRDRFERRWTRRTLIFDRASPGA